MEKLGVLLLVFMMTGCAMSAKEITADISRCEVYELVPVIVIGRRENVKRVTCTVPPEKGYTIVEKGISLPSLPSLPNRPAQGE